MATSKDLRVSQGLNGVLFFGEDLDDVITGISVSNRLVLGELEKFRSVEKIVDKNVLGYSGTRKNLLKIAHLLKMISAFVSKSRKHYDYFYVPLSVSRLGALKILLAIICSKIFIRVRSIVLHLHRGDFESKYKTMSLPDKLIFRLIFKMSNKILVLDEEQTELFINEFGLHAEVLRNTTDLESQFPSLNDFANNDILYISNFIPEKGYQILVSAFGSIDNDSIKMVMAGKPSLMDDIEYIQSIDDPRISVFGPVIGEEKIGLIKKSGIFVLPSLNEGQPISIIEAICAGLVVIATRVGLVPKMFPPNYPFLVSPGDEKALKSALEHALTLDNDERRKLIDQNRNWYDANFSNRAHQKHLRRIFD